MGDEETEKVVENDTLSRLKTVLWYLILIAGLAILVVYWSFFINIDKFILFIEKWGAKVSIAVFTVFVIHLFLNLTRPILKRAHLRRGGKIRDWKVMNNIFTYLLWVFTGLVIFTGFFGSPSSFGISIGLFGAGLAFALQQPILSLSGWLLIMIKRPFTIGDRIVLTKEGIMGDVDDITVFFFVLKSVTKEEAQTGRSVIVPNSAIFQGPITNYSFDTPHVWESIPVSVTYESDLGLAEKIIYEAALKVGGDETKKGARLMKRKIPDSVQADLIRDTPTIRIEFADSSITINARILCLAKQIRGFKTEIYREVFKQFNLPENKDKVEIAYPHMEIVMQKEKHTI